MTSRKCLLLVMGVMCTFFATDIHAQEKVIQTLRKRLEGVVPPKQEEVYVVFARKTMDSMTRIENWQDLTNQQRDMIVRSTVKLARRWKSIFAKKGFAQASKNKERLRSLLKGWIGMVAIDLTQPIDTPMEKKARKEVFSELADTLTHAKKLGRAGKKVTRKEMSQAERNAAKKFKASLLKQIRAAR